MSNELMSLLILFGILVLGYLIVYFRSKPIQKNKEYASKFREKLHIYFASHGQDQATLEWLVKKSVKMQQLTFIEGIRYTFTRPFTNLTYNNYSIITNGIVHLKDEFKPSWSSSDEDAKMYLEMIDHVLLSYIGICENSSDDNKKDYNPFKAFSIGVRSILLSPIKLVHSFGIIGDKTYFKIIENGLVIFATNLTALVGLVDQIYALITGWDSFLVKIIAIF